MSDDAAPSTEIAHRLTEGVVVERGDVEHAGRVVVSLLEEKQDLGRLEAALKDLVREYHETYGGTQTLHVGGAKITIGARTDTLYDAQLLEDGLREAGMPEAAIREIVVEEISYKVNATKAKQAAKASAKYAAAVEAASTVVDKIPSVQFAKG